MEFIVSLQVYWNLGVMDFPLIGKYQCQSWYDGEMATNVTTFLAGFELDAPEVRGFQISFD